MPGAIKTISLIETLIRTFTGSSKENRLKVSFCTAVIAAAGSSLRFGEDKLMCKIKDKPLLINSIEAYQKNEYIKEIIVVTKQENLEQIAALCKEYKLSKVTKVIAGGETRTQSVYNGIMAVSRKAKLIAIHDGARPCITDDIICKTIKTAQKYHAAAPGVPVISTLKKADMRYDKSHSGYGLTIMETLGREGLFEIQTPQVFKADIIKAALTKAIRDDVSLTDDCMAVEQLGMPVHITEGSRTNIKVTENSDIKLAEALL